MLQTKLLLMLLFSFLRFSETEKITQPEQSDTGCGGKEYLHTDFEMFDFGDEQDGFWLIEPRTPKPDSVSVVVFMHGYSAYNPMVYGKWLRHLVQKGNTVIYPRYQKNILTPHHSKFVENTAAAVKKAYEKMNDEGFIKPKQEAPIMVGHSFGGAIIANLLPLTEEYEIPKPAAVMLVSPGTGVFDSFEFPTYHEIPSDIKMLITVSAGDLVVGQKFGKKVFETAINTPARNLIRQQKDKYGTPKISHDHLECYAPDTAFDNGMHGYSYRRAKRAGVVDAVDYNGYWKLLDALSDCAREGKNCNIAFGNTPEQRSLGEWSDGKKINELEVSLPDDWSPWF